MSVFKKLKGTFQNAQQDIVDGLRALTSLDSQSRNDQLRSLRARDISLNAGADLLHNYQKQWSAIQTDTKESAKKAEEVSTFLTPMFKVWDKHSETVAQFETEVKSIPTLLTTLEQLHALLEGLRQDFIVAEKSLDMLENLCEEQELKAKFLEEQKKLAMYKVWKEAEAERVKVELAQKHAKKMAELEMTKKVNLQERAEAFTSAFQEDLDYYKTHGHPSRMPTEFPKVSSLSEIELEEDKQALDSFLGTSAEPDTEPGALELSGEGTYIEDDYLPQVPSSRDEQPDFSVKKDLEVIDMADYNISSCTMADLEDDDDDDETDKDKLAERSSELAQKLDVSIKFGTSGTGEPENFSVVNDNTKILHSNVQTVVEEENSSGSAGKTPEMSSSSIDSERNVRDSDNAVSKDSDIEGVAS